jgi:hypothetical protein
LIWRQVREELRLELGEIDWASEPIPFAFTSYYADEMGDRISGGFLSVSVIWLIRVLL